MLTCLINIRSPMVLWLVEDNLWWKTTLGGRQIRVEEPLVETTLVERQPWVEDDLRWKMNFGGRRPSVDPCMLPSPLCGIFDV